ncbi:hypothetical protein VP01_119g7 [Puccinia sorghi]|uniref:Uncharacterized protein n=1 Tax=Puccinia sorghi TaxID=27349 RepID=A0A0L6VQN0_9BASI|nr:hypothetical protein VP01_119g7 [Puccinia sorghi]
MNIEFDMLCNCCIFCVNLKVVAKHLLMDLGIFQKEISDMLAFLHKILLHLNELVSSIGMRRHLCDYLKFGFHPMSILTQVSREGKKSSSFPHPSQFSAVKIITLRHKKSSPLRLSELTGGPVKGDEMGKINEIECPPDPQINLGPQQNKYLCNKKCKKKSFSDGLEIDHNIEGTSIQVLHETVGIKLDFDIPLSEIPEEFPAIPEAFPAMPEAFSAMACDFKFLDPSCSISLLLARSICSCGVGMVNRWNNEITWISHYPINSVESSNNHVNGLDIQNNSGIPLHRNHSPFKLTSTLLCHLNYRLKLVVCVTTAIRGLTSNLSSIFTKSGPANQLRSYTCFHRNIGGLSRSDNQANAPIHPIFSYNFQALPGSSRKFFLISKHFLEVPDNSFEFPRNAWKKFLRIAKHYLGVAGNFYNFKALHQSSRKFLIISNHCLKFLRIPKHFSNTPVMAEIPVRMGGHATGIFGNATRIAQNPTGIFRNHIGNMAGNLKGIGHYPIIIGSHLTGMAGNTIGIGGNPIGIACHHT